LRARGGVVDVAQLDLDIPGGPRAGSAPPLPPDAAEVRDAPASFRLELLERDAITRALALHGGNRTRAAKALGIHRSTLLRRLQELGLERGDPGGPEGSKKGR